MEFEKPNEKFDGIEIAYEETHGSEWRKVVLVKIWDITRNQAMGDDYFFYVTSPKYSVPSLPAMDKKYIIEQPIFNYEDAEAEARRRFDSIVAETWDDFHDQMYAVFDSDDTEYA